MIRVSLTVLAVATLFVAASACTRRTVSLAGRPCDAGRCISGYTCDAATDRCVAANDACTEEGRHIPCTYGASTCADGCRVCALGVWSACEQPTDPPQCTANTTFCSDPMHLATCGSVGYIDRTAPCDYGCNAIADPPRCNECVPGSTQCHGVVFVQCSSVGSIVSQQNCQSESQCTNVGACDDVAGCETMPIAPDGTPCDEGQARDGNLCNSACDDGVCTTAVAVNCDDGLACTTDRCATAEGCRHDTVAQGTICRAAVGACDVAETCSGLPSECPVDAVAPPGETCRASVDTCDVAELCDGATTACPADLLHDAGFLCRPAADSCDDDDYCTGSSAVCPEIQGNPDGSVCGTMCDGTEYIESRCMAHRCVAQTPIECNDLQTCNGSETCDPNPEVRCVPGSGGTCHDACACSIDTCTDSPLVCTSDADFTFCEMFAFAPVATTYAQKSAVALTLVTNCGGEAANITCTTNDTARLCIHHESFDDGTTGGFSGTGLTGNLDCPAGANLSSIAENNCSSKVIGLASTGSDASLTVNVSDALNAMRLHVKSALAVNATEAVVLYACCDGSGLCSDNAQTVTTNDYWKDQPCVWNGDPPCPGVGYGLPTGAVFDTFDGCGTIRARMTFSNGSNRNARIDDFAISAVGTHTLPVNDNGDGTYTVSLRPCAAGNVDVTCTWNVPDGRTLSDTVRVAVP